MFQVSITGSNILDISVDKLDKFLCSTTNEHHCTCVAFSQKQSVNGNSWQICEQNNIVKDIATNHPIHADSTMKCIYYFTVKYIFHSQCKKLTTTYVDAHCTFNYHAHQTIH